MARAPICVRLPAEIEDEIRATFEDLGVGPSTGLRIIVEEWLALTRFPVVEFRDTPFGRRAAIKGGPEIWEIIRLWQTYQTSQEFYEHFGWLDRDAVDQATSYYMEHPTAVDDILEANDRVSYREFWDPLDADRKAKE